MGGVLLKNIFVLSHQEDCEQMVVKRTQISHSYTVILTTSTNFGAI